MTEILTPGYVTEGLESLRQAGIALRDIAVAMPQDALAQAAWEHAAATEIQIELMARQQAGLVWRTALVGVAVDLAMRLIFGRK